MDNTNDETQRLDLRPYQREALHAIEAAEARGIRRVAVALPTGAGKTIIFAELVRRRGGRALVLAHRDELISQAVEKVGGVHPSCRVGIVKAERDEVSADIVVASVQTLAHPARLARLGRDFTTVVVDEAHHATSPTYRAILEHVRAFSPGGPLVLGVSATFHRADGAALGDVFEEVAFERTIRELIDAGHLCDIRGMQIKLRVDFARLHVVGGDFDEGELEGMLLDAKAPEHAVEAYEQHAAGRKAIVFTPTVHVARLVAAAFRGNGHRVEVVDGKTPCAERRALLARFRTGETQIVVNCGVLVEGYDNPSVDCIVVMRPTSSLALYTQMVGRGTRLHPGKTDLLVLDLVGATERHDLVTSATLLGLSPDATEARSLVAGEAEEKPEDEPSETDGELVARDVDLFDRSKVCWVVDGQRRYVSTRGGGVLKVVSGPDGWTVLVGGRSGMRMLADGVDARTADAVAQDCIRTQGLGRFVDPAASWRGRPATRSQVRQLEALGLAWDERTDGGVASDLITHARGRKWFADDASDDDERSA